MKIYLVTLAFILFSIFLLGIFWLVTSSSEMVGLTLAFAAGLSMIILPCTLPLVFVIVPLSMGRTYKKGLFMAVLFGSGLVITLTTYGIVISQIGKVFGLDRATMIMYFIAGTAAFTFGLSELKLLRFTLPAYTSTPDFIHKQSDYLKSFFLGLFLGNAGVGCPNPAFYVLLTYIAGTGSILTGASLGAIHGIGRALPLIFFSILGILGINTIESLNRKRVSIERILGWALVVIGAFLIVNGIPGGHEWYEETFIHEGWNTLILNIGGEQLAERLMHEEEPHEIEGIGLYSPWILLFLILIPIIWYKMKR